MFIVAVCAVTVSRHKSRYLQYQSAALVQYHNMLLAHECVFIFALVLYSWTCTKNHLLTLKRQRVFLSVRYFAISLFLARIAAHRLPLSVSLGLRECIGVSVAAISVISSNFDDFWAISDNLQISDKISAHFLTIWILKITELNDASFVNSQLQSGSCSTQKLLKCDLSVLLGHRYPWPLTTSWSDAEYS